MALNINWDRQNDNFLVQQLKYFHLQIHPTMPLPPPTLTIRIIIIIARLKLFSAPCRLLLFSSRTSYAFPLNHPQRTDDNADNTNKSFPCQSINSIYVAGLWGVEIYNPLPNYRPEVSEMTAPLIAIRPFCHSKTMVMSWESSRPSPPPRWCWSFGGDIAWYIWWICANGPPLVVFSLMLDN